MGIEANPLRALCRHYGAHPKTLEGVTTSEVYKLYTQTGWKGDQLAPEVVDFLNQRAAVVLLSGSDYRPPSDEVPGSDYRPPADEVEVPGSKNRLPAGEVEVPASDDRHRAGKVPGKLSLIHI